MDATRPTAVSVPITEERTSVGKHSAERQSKVFQAHDEKTLNNTAAARMPGRDAGVLLANPRPSDAPASGKSGAPSYDFPT